MKIFILLILIVSSLSSVVYSQITFQKTYNASMMDLFTNVQQTSDGGFIISGRNFSFPPIYSSLIKVDTAGTIEWAKEYGDGELAIIGGTYFLNDVKITSDGGYILTGECSSDPLMSSDYDDLFLIKTDALGAEQWSYSYGGGDSDCGNFVMQTSDGGYLSVGYTYSFGTVTKDSTNIYMVKTNSSGTLLWDRAVEISPDDDDVAYSVEEASDGYIVVGKTDQVFAGVDTTTDIVILKTSTAGVVEWLNTYGDDDEEESANAVELINNGSIIVSGSTTESVTGIDASDAYIIDIDGAGNITWSNSYDIGFADEAQSINKTSDGGFTIIGFTIASLLPLNFKSFLMKASSAGTIEFAMHYGTDMSFNIFSNGQQTSDDGYVIGTIGTTGYDFYLIKTNMIGESGCNDTSFTATKRTFAPPPITTAHTDFNGGSRIDIETEINDITPTETTLCIQVPCDTPIVVITPPASTICEGESVTLTASGTTSYLWNTGATTASIIVSPTTTTTYTVNGFNGVCPAYPVQITVTVIPAPNPLITGIISICDGESTTLTASGGDTYEWSSGDNTAATTITPAISTTYTVTVTNTGTGCTATASQLVTVSSIPIIVITGTNEICEGESTTLTASGGDTYNWNNGANTDAITVTPVINTTYYVTVSIGGAGCSDTSSYIVTVNPLPIITISGDTSLCIGDTTILTATGGGDYLWNTTDITEAITVFPIADITYYVTVTNSITGCLDIDTVDVYVHPLPTASASSTSDTICEGQTAILNASGGTTYLWEPQGSLDDPNIANPGATPDSTTTYYVTVTNDFGCTDVSSVTININPAPEFSLSSTNITCNGGFDGTASVNIIGGVPPVTFVWENSSIDTTLTNLDSDYYNVTVTDGIGCFASDSILVYEPMPLSDSIIITNISCTGLTDGQIVLIVSGGTSPYYYLWNNSATSSSINNLIAGTYSVTITDDNGCELIEPKIDIIEPDSLLFTFNSQNVYCHSGNNGYAQVVVAGGTPPYTYNWSNSQTASTCIGLTSGVYVVTITDYAFCTESGQITITEPLEILFSNEIVPASCIGNIDGEISIIVYGGVKPYTYLWSNQATEALITGLSAGEYTITVTDYNNCVFDETFMLNELNVSCLEIPTLFTPNGDGSNDVWNIMGIELYPNVEIEIFNRWGNVIFESKGYTEPWDGTFKGRALPLSSYIYIITLNNGSEPIQGIVTIKH